MRVEDVVESRDSGPKRRWRMLDQSGRFGVKDPAAIRLGHDESLDMVLTIPSEVSVHLIDFRFHNIHTDQAKLDTGVIEAYLDGKRIVPTAPVWGRPLAPGFHVALPTTDWGTHAILVHDDQKLCRMLSGRQNLFSFKWKDDHERHSLLAKSFEYFLVTE